MPTSPQATLSSGIVRGTEEAGIAVRQELRLAGVGSDVPQCVPAEGAGEDRHRGEDQDDADRDDR
ncbi:hypothetical protein, partial [Microbacterium sp. BF1]|uniref:hypothetical protein n=1 Tax=Microbacterium sp. BF1 TaxID=2821146 RepID=UPI001C4E1D12